MIGCKRAAPFLVEIVDQERILVFPIDCDASANASQHNPHAARVMARQFDPEFQTTDWTIILDAGDRESDSQRFAKLLLSYWYPCYAFLRRKGVDCHDAEDLVQGFFASVLERDDWIGRADPHRGKFRSFLVKSLEQYRQRVHRSATAKKRAPSAAADGSRFEAIYSATPLDELSPERMFEYSWAVSIVRESMETLKAQCESEGRALHFEQLSGFLYQESKISGRQAAEKLGMNEAAVRVYIHRLKVRLAKIIRQRVCETVRQPQEVDEELAHLIRTLSLT